MKKALIALGCLVLVFAVSITVDTTSTAVAGKSYSGTVYIGGPGGHFAKANVIINPSALQPIKISKLDRVVIGDKKSYPVHDARIDTNDSSRMFWSTIFTDKAKGENSRIAHVGIVDLKSRKVIKDVEIKLDDRAKFAGPIYCGSGQTKDSYMPMTMTGEAYIDIFDKRSLKLKKRVFLKDIGYYQNYQFLHGTNSPDMKTFAVTLTMTEKWTDPSKPAKRTGEVDMLLLDLPALEQGELKVLKKNTLPASPTGTFTFRQTFTPDGKYLLQAGRDRFYLLDGSSLELLDMEMISPAGNENHDAVNTPDGKYGVLIIRTKHNDGDKTGIDGALQLYDIEARKVIGEPVSVCNSCHAKIGIKVKATLCGADVNWN